MPAPPSPPQAAKAPTAPETPVATLSPQAPEAPTAAKAPEAPKDDGAEKKRLSGKHWKNIADEKWPGSDSVDTLSDEFKPKAQAFLKILEENAISFVISATLRPKERSYLFHYCLEVASDPKKAMDIPKLDGVDINWDHGDEAKSKTAAKEMADAFGLVGVAAHPSNHNGGDAIDFKMDFSKNTKDGKNVLRYKVGDKEISREIKVDDEAPINGKAAGMTIDNIGSRELSKAGEDFGVKRGLKNDIVHWSLTGQ
jgi:hypothetical protein